MTRESQAEAIFRNAMKAIDRLRVDVKLRHTCTDGKDTFMIVGGFLSDGEITFERQLPAVMPVSNLS